MNKGLKMLAVTRGREGQGQNEMRNNRNEMRNGMEMNRMGNEMRSYPARNEMEMRGYAPRTEMEMRGYNRDRRGRFTGEMEDGYGESNMENRYRDRSGRSAQNALTDYTRTNDPSAGRWLPPYYTEPESNSRRGEGDRGSGNRMARNDPSRMEEGGNMRMIGFGRELYEDMPPAATIPKNQEMSHVPNIRALPGGAKSSMGMDERTAKEWTATMKNEDGTRGPHWTMEQIKKVMEQRNMPGDPVEFWVAMNMMYSDYCKVAKKLGVNSVDFYAEMAKAFLEDKDTGAPDKLMAYYESIVKG